MGDNNIRECRTFRKIAAVSGIIQGLTWLTLAAACIGMYYADPTRIYEEVKGNILDEDSRYISLISFSFFDTLLYDDNNYEDRLLKPQNFHVFAWIYAGLSLCWLCLSVAESIALLSRKSSKYEAHGMILSAIIIVVTCILDLILMSMAFKDYFDINVFKYDDVVSWDSTSTSTLEEFQGNIDLVFKYKIGRKLAYGILITICTRGFLIWIFNCTSAVVLLLISVKIFRAPPILKYENRSIPRAKYDSTAAQRDKESFFGSTFAEDYNHTSPPTQQRIYSTPNVPSAGPSDRFPPEPSWNRPLALNSQNRRSENRFS